MIRSIGIVTVGLVLGGCLGARSIERAYYVLESPTAGMKTADGALPGRIYVRDLEVERIYDKAQLVVRRSPYVLYYSGTHSWAVRPNRMVSDIVGDALRETGAFSAVTRQLAEGRPDYTMTGTLRAIEVVTDSTPWRARIAVSLELVRFDDGLVLWRHVFDDARPVAPGDLDSVPEAISQVLHVGLRRASADLVDSANAIRSVPSARGSRRTERGGS